MMASISILQLAIVLLPLMLVYLLVRSITSGGPDRRRDAEDVKLVQDLHRQIQHMEHRIEALETIMFDRESARAKSDNR